MKHPRITKQAGITASAFTAFALAIVSCGGNEQTPTPTPRPIPTLASTPTPTCVSSIDLSKLPSGIYPLLESQGISDRYIQMEVALYKRMESLGVKDYATYINDELSKANISLGTDVSGSGFELNEKGNVVLAVYYRDGSNTQFSLIYDENCINENDPLQVLVNGAKQLINEQYIYDPNLTETDAYKPFLRIAYGERDWNNPDSLNLIPSTLLKPIK